MLCFFYLLFRKIWKEKIRNGYQASYYSEGIVIISFDFRTFMENPDEAIMCYNDN